MAESDDRLLDETFEERIGRISSQRELALKVRPRPVAIAHPRPVALSEFEQTIKRNSDYRRNKRKALVPSQVAVRDDVIMHRFGQAIYSIPKTPCRDIALDLITTKNEKFICNTLIDAAISIPVYNITDNRTITRTEVVTLTTQFRLHHGAMRISTNWVSFIDDQFAAALEALIDEINQEKRPPRTVYTDIDRDIYKDTLRRINDEYETHVSDHISDNEIVRVNAAFICDANAAASELKYVLNREIKSITDTSRYIVCPIYLCTTGDHVLLDVDLCVSGKRKWMTKYFIESDTHANIREVFEETGLILDRGSELESYPSDYVKMWKEKKNYYDLHVYDSLCDSCERCCTIPSIRGSDVGSVIVSEEHIVGLYLIPVAAYCAGIRECLSLYNPNSGIDNIMRILDKMHR